MGGGGKRGGDTRIRGGNKGEWTNGFGGSYQWAFGFIISIYIFVGGCGEVTGQGQVTHPSAVYYITDQLGNHQLGMTKGKRDMYCRRGSGDLRG